jgi:hypothetical protein
MHRKMESLEEQVCYDIIIGVVSVYMQYMVYNCVYCYDTCTCVCDVHRKMEGLEEQVKPFRISGFNRCFSIE